MSEGVGCPLYGRESCPFTIEVQPGRVFVAHPFSRMMIRTRLDSLATGLAAAEYPLAVDFLYADTELSLNAQVLCKICRQVQSSQFCLCDLTADQGTSVPNANVLIECGLALGKGVPVVLAFRKGQAGSIPSDLAGLDRLEYRTYPHLADQLKAKLPVHLQAPEPAAPPASGQWLPEYSTDFSGQDFDDDAWRVEVGDPPIVRQSNGLWMEWHNAQAHLRSGNLTLRALLTYPFRAAARLRYTALGTGWDPGIYLYAGSGMDMVLGVNLMPAAANWGIPTPSVLVRTPRVPSDIDRWNYNVFQQSEALPGSDVALELEVTGRLARAKVDDLDWVDVPLPDTAAELVVGGFRWVRATPEMTGRETSACVISFAFERVAG